MFGWVMLFLFFCGAEISIVYNRDKAKEVRKNIWQKALTVAKYISEFKQAIF